MSFGDPNNPYGQQQGQPPQQGYGYPQQGQQPGQQPGYGYPQAPPVGQYGDFPGGPMTQMPGTLKAARIMLFVIGGLQLIGAAIFALAAVAVQKAKEDPKLRDDIDFEQLADYSTNLLWGFTVAILVWGVIAVFLGAKVGNGGNGIRIATIVFASITALLGIYPFLVVGIVHLVLAVLIIVFCAKADGGAWFNRPRQQSQY